MAQTIVVPSGDRLEFPDGMSDADIEKAIFAEYPDLAPKPGVFDRIKSALAPSADRAPMPSTSETINAPSSEFDTGATAATEGAISMPGSVMDGYVPRESDQGVSADSGMGPMRQSYYDETRAGLLSAPIQSHAAAAQAGGQVGKVARDTLPQRLDKAGRELSGDILPKNRQELTDDIQAGRYREDEIGSMSDPDAGLSEFGKAVKFGFSAAGDSANPLIRGAGQGVAGFGQWAAGLGEIIGDMTGNGDLVISAQDMRRRWKSFENEATGQGQFRKMADVTQAKDSGAKWLEEGVQNAANSITRQLPGLLTGSTGPALTMMFMDSLGTEYGIAKAAGRPADEALSRAALFAGFEVAGEKLALDYMMPRLRDMARGVSTEKLPQFFAGLISREVPGELFTHGGQSAVDATKALGLRPDMTLEQYFAEIPAVVRDTIIQSGLMAGSGSAMNAGIRAVRSSTDDLTAGRDFIQASIDAAARQSLDPANAQLFRSGGLLSTPIVPRATPADVAAAETPEAAAAAIADIGAGIAGSVPITEALAATQAEIDALLSEPIESAALPQTPIPVPPMTQPGAVAADLRQPQVDSLSTSPTPIVNATPEGGAKSLGFVEAFASLQGGGITEKLYAQAFDALQNGKTTIAGIRDPLLQRAKAAFDAGLIKSPADIRGFEQGGYPSIPNPSPAPIVTQQSDNSVPPGLAQMRARVAERQASADAPVVKESLMVPPTARPVSTNSPSIGNEISTQPAAPQPQAAAEIPAVQVPEIPAIAPAATVPIQEAETAQPPARLERKKNFTSSTPFSVETEDSGTFPATVHRTPEGGAVIQHDDGLIEHNAAFASGKTDEELLRYSFEPLGYVGATTNAEPAPAGAQLQTGGQDGQGQKTAEVLNAPAPAASPASAVGAESVLQQDGVSREQSIRIPLDVNPVVASDREGNTESRTPLKLESGTIIDSGSGENKDGFKSPPAITRIKGGKLEITGFDRDEVADVLKTAKITATVTAGKDGRVLVSATDRAGNATKISIKQQNAISKALLGATAAPKKARKLSGNLKNDLDIIAPGLYGEVARGGDGEANDAAWGDVSLIAEKMRDEQGYMLPHDANGQDLANSLRELIRQHAGGDVVLNEARQAAAMTEEETKRHRSDVLRLADEYGIETKRGIIPRRLEDIEAELEAAIIEETGIAAKSTASVRDAAIAAGISVEEVDALIDQIVDFHADETSADKFVLMYREQANAIQEKIDANQEREGRDGQNASAVEHLPAPQGSEGRPALELAGQSEAEARADEERVEAAKEAEEAEAREAEAKARKEQAAKDKADIQNRLANQPFEFGVGAKEAKTVQRDLLSQPAPDSKTIAEASPADLLRAAADKMDEAAKPKVASEGGKPVATKEPWQMGLLEYGKSRLPKATADKITSDTQVANFSAQHIREIKAALERGDEVPAEVLREYRGQEWADVATQGKETPASLPSEAAKEMDAGAFIPQEPLPSAIEALPAGSRSLYKVDELAEQAKTAWSNRRISDELNERGTADTPEMAMRELSNLRDIVTEQDGKLRSKNRTGATPGNLLTNWLELTRAINTINKSRREEPAMWAAYDERQKVIAAMNVGDRVRDPYTSTEHPLGTPATIERKFSKNWRVKFDDGSTELYHPSTLRPFEEVGAGETAESQAAVAQQPADGNTPAEVIEQADAIEPATPTFETAQSEERIGDFGRKVLVRKDSALPTGRRVTMPKEQDDRPVWARRIKVMQQSSSGKWQIMEEAKGRHGMVRAMTSARFDTEQEALDAIHQVVVAQRHRIYKDGDAKWGIWRNITDKKRAMVKGEFDTYEDAKEYMAQNAAEIIEHKFPFPERPWLDRIERTGKDHRNGKNVTKQMFEKTFAPGGVVYGNWLLESDGKTVNADGQELSNYIYDGLMDLADALGIPPKALFLDGEMVLGIGADGKGGKNSAAAHYSPDKGLINLTKIKGAGSLAHEWWHSVDHYFAKNGGRKDSASVVEGGFPHDSTARPDLIAAIKSVIDTMMYAEKSTTTDADLVRQRAQKRIDEAVKSLDYYLNDWRSQIKDNPYGSGKKRGKGATSAQLQQWDDLAAKLREGDMGEEVYIENPSKLRGAMGFNVGEAIRDLNAIYKAVTGRSFLRTDPDSQGRRMYWTVKAIADNKVALATQDDVTTTSKGRTAFYIESRRIDSEHSGDYWSKPEEMGARAFESYIFDKLTAGEKRSDYLVYAVENRYYAIFDQKPYPEGDERQAINGAFDALFSTIETKETDKGVALESRALQDSEDGLSSENGLPNRNLDGTIDAAALRGLRREAAGLESPERGTYLRVTADGRAIATGEKGTRVPETFTRFAEKHGLTFDARRIGPGNGAAGSDITRKSQPMPVEYRESGAMYFGESGAFIDRTGKTRFSKSPAATITNETPATIRAGLHRSLGKATVDRLEQNGLLRILDTADSLPNGLTISSTGTALYDGKTAYLIADRMQPETAIREVLHEIGEHHGLEGMLGKEGYATLVRRVRAMDKFGNKRVREAFSTVRDLYPEYADNSAEFMHEVLANIGQDADIQAKPWWQEMLAAVRRFLVKLGYGGLIRTSDIEDMVLHSLKVAAQSGKSNDGMGAGLRLAPNAILQSVYTRSNDGSMSGAIADEKAGVSPIEIWRRHGWLNYSGQWRRAIATDHVRLTSAITSNPVRLFNAISFPEIQSIYPELADIIVLRGEVEGTADAVFDVEKKSITVSTKTKPSEYLKKIIHEIQHAIQELDLRESGTSHDGTVSSFMDYYMNEGEIEARDAEETVALSQAELRARTPALLDENMIAALAIRNEAANSPVSATEKTNLPSVISAPSALSAIQGLPVLPEISEDFDDQLVASVANHGDDLISYFKSIGVDVKSVSVKQQTKWMPEARPKDANAYNINGVTEYTTPGWSTRRLLGDLTKDDPKPVQVGAVVVNLTVDKQCAIKYESVLQAAGFDAFSGDVGSVSIRIGYRPGRPSWDLKGEIPTLESVVKANRRITKKLSDSRGMVPAMADMAVGGMASRGAVSSAPTFKAQEVRDSQGRLLAPNGKPSRLNERQWHQVRSPEFKAWFGDWEKHANAENPIGSLWADEGVSKVVDANGEPLVVYHGTDEDITEFDPKKQRPGRWGKGFYFASSPERAKQYGKNVIPVYLRIERSGARDIDADGMIIGSKPSDRIYVVQDPAQIKSAEKNTGAFSRDNPSILESRNRGLLNRDRDEDLDPDTSEAAAVQAGIEGRSPRDAAQFIIDTGSEFQREVAQKVLIQLNRLALAGVKLELKVAHNEQKVPGQLTLARGLTDWSFAKDGNRITVWINGADVVGKVGTSYTTLLHELIHMATAGVIHLGGLKAASTYKTGKDVADLIAVTDHVRDHFNQRVADAEAGNAELTDFEQRIKKRANNALDSADEVLAWALSNPNAQAYMEAIPYPAHESAWSAFVSAIRRILGIPEQHASAFTELLRVADNLMSDNVNEILGIDTSRGFNTIIQMPRGSGQLAAINSRQQALPNTGATPPAPPTRQTPIGLQGGATGNNASWNGYQASKLDDVIRTLQDKYIDSKRTVQAIKAAGRQVADKWNVYEQETKFHGRAAKRTLEFVETELTPLARDLAMRGLTLAELEEYLHARHAPEANALIAQRNPAIPDGGSGMTNQQAAGYFANLDPSKRRRLAASAARVDAIIAGTRQAYVSYGLESQDTINGWAATFQHYVPLMREDKDGAMGIGQGFSIKGKESKSRTGSTRAVVDILANIAMQRERAITRGEKNRVSVSLLGLAKLNPNPDFWTVDRVPMIVGLNPATGMVESHPDPNYKNRENVVVAKVPDGKGGVQERAVIFNEDSEPAMNMALALKNLDVAHLEGFMGAAATVTRYFASINTQYNPVFGVANLFRDTQEAMLNLGSTPIAGRQADVLKHTLGALRGIYIDTRQMRKGQPALSSYAQLWEEFQHEGGQTGYREMFRTSADRAHAIERAINPYRWMDSTLGQIFTAAGMLKVPMKVAQDKAGWLFDWLSDYNEAMENAVRLSAYKVGIDNGMSKHQAIVMAKGLTVNFNRKGQIAQQAGALYAFFNAAVQGTGRLTQTLFTMQGNDIKTARLSRLGVKIVAGGILWGSLQALMLMAAGFGEDDPPEFVREKNTIIPWKAATLGLVDTKQYTTIPMPLGFAIFPNIGRLATEFVMGGFKNPGKYMVKILGIMADAFNPIGGNGTVLQMVTPTALDPLAALSENKDWTKKPIAKVSYDKTKPGFTLWKDTASTPSKMIAEAINSLSGGTKYVAGKLSPTPDQIDYLFGQVTGGVGRELGKLEQSVVAAATGDELPPHKIPLVGRFYGNSDASSSQGTTFYNTIQRMNEHEATIKGLRKDGKGAEAAQYIADNPEARLVMRANHVERQVQKMRKEKHDLIEKGATRERVKAVEERIKIDMRRFNEAIEALKKRQKEAA